MKNDGLDQRLAVCSWSLQPVDPPDLVAKLQGTGIRRVQLALDPLQDAPGVWGVATMVRHSRTAYVLQDAPGVWGVATALLGQHGIEIVSGMFGFPGEDYSTPETIRVTGGIAPDDMWPRNWEHVQASADLAQKLGLKLITFHAGFLPHEEQDPHRARMEKRLAQVAELFRAKGIVLALETGQETAPVLVQFLQKFQASNLAVNFDPANMILYDRGNPIDALSALGPWIRQVHIKDATRTKVSGAWGEEVPVGTGEVDWRAFFATLKRLNYTGDFVIEREAGQRRLADIKAAKEVVERMFS
jgi:L-ribulose-5-phosphate 3-epimerase